MANEGFPVASDEILPPEDFLARHGLEDLAGIMVEAHGGRFTVGQSYIECPPFAKMLTGLVASLEHVPNKEDILRQTITSMAAETAEAPVPEAAKKKF